MAEKTAKPTANPAAPEVFADRASSVSLRGNVARVTFVSDRTASDADGPQPIVSGHVAMSVRGFVQLFSQMQSVVRQMEENGLLQRKDTSGSAETGSKKKAASPTKPKASATPKASRKRSSRAKK